MKQQKSVRMCMVATPELEDRVYSLRQREEFKRCSVSEILRMLIETGLKALDKEA